MKHLRPARFHSGNVHRKESNFAHFLHTTPLFNTGFLSLFQQLYTHFFQTWYNDRTNYALQFDNNMNDVGLHSRSQTCDHEKANIVLLIFLQHLGTVWTQFSMLLKLMLNLFLPSIFKREPYFDFFFQENYITGLQFQFQILFKMASQRSERPIHTLPCLSAVSRRMPLSLKQRKHLVEHRSFPT